MSTHESHEISVMLNGQALDVPPGRTLLTLVETLGLKPDRLAIELNRKIIKPAEWKETEIRDGAEIEIVHFVGGG